ncbi:hypothetical protein F5Y14DRAFT_434688 [Nemania sp. NC0429]|nr:hypothetical protein F5Y14DRAFT_434688 [Nemania sp. NC0429]
MDVAAAAHRRRVEARAVGRTPEEHAALELALARRRQARLPPASPAPRPGQRHHHHRQHHHPPPPPSPVEREDGGHARFQPSDSPDFERRVEEDDREDSPADGVPEFYHEIDDRDMYRVFNVIQAEAELENPHGMRSTSFSYFDYAMFRARVAAAKSGPTPPALGVPPARKSKPKFSWRDVRGAGWHRRGYRSHGHMWINVKEGSYGHTRGTDVHENRTLSDFVKDVFHMWATGKYPEGWYCDLFFRKKSVTRLLVDLEKHGLDMDLVLVKDYFDGGETVYFKLFDLDGEQQSQVPFG